MAEKNEKISINLLNELNTTGAGYDVLRYISLPNLLGSETDTVLYFLGKELARSFHLESLEDIYIISEKLGWGKMELLKERKSYLLFTLMSDELVRRIKSPLKLDFRLEAGFLAEAINMINGIDCECSEKVNEKLFQVQFKVVFAN